eukprot:5425641-Amphidinium_carterae.1
MADWPGEPGWRQHVYCHMSGRGIPRKMIHQRGQGGKSLLEHPGVLCEKGVDPVAAPETGANRRRKRRQSTKCLLINLFAH